MIAAFLIALLFINLNEDIKEAATKAVFKCFLKPGLTELAKKLFMEEKYHTTVAAITTLILSMDVDVGGRRFKPTQLFFVYLAGASSVTGFKKSCEGLFEMRRDTVAQMAAEAGAKYFVHVMMSDPVDYPGFLGHDRTMKHASEKTFLVGKETKYALKGHRGVAARSLRQIPSNRTIVSK